MGKAADESDLSKVHGDVLAAKAGCQEALHRLWLTAEPIARRFAERHCQKYFWIDPDELTQDMLVHLPRILARYDPDNEAGNSWSKYLYHRLYFCAKDCLRAEDPLGISYPQKKQYPAWSRLGDESLAGFEAVDPSSVASEHLVDPDVAALVASRAALDCVSPPRRTVRGELCKPRKGKTVRPRPHPLPEGKRKKRPKKDRVGLRPFLRARLAGESQMLGVAIQPAGDIESDALAMTTENSNTERGDMVTDLLGEQDETPENVEAGSEWEPKPKASRRGQGRGKPWTKARRDAHNRQLREKEAKLLAVKKEKQDVAKPKPKRSYTRRAAKPAVSAIATIRAAKHLVDLCGSVRQAIQLLEELR